jgi:nucleoside-diphosphate-sugar epimerase
MPTTLITGGAGFIGVRLAARLQALGEKVVLLDRRFAPEATAGLAADTEMTEGNTSDFEGLRRVVAAVKPDGIVHLAAILSGQSEGDPALAFTVNVAGLFNALEAARREGVRKVVATSSAAVIEATEPTPPNDEETPLEPLGVYGMTKLVGEAWCKFYHRRFGIDARVARPGAVVGPGRVAGGAVSSWTTALIEEPLLGHPYVCPVAEDDASTLVYHTDLVDGLLRLYLAEHVPSRVYNLGACSASVAEIVRLVRERVPDAKITFQPDPIARFVVGRWRYAVQDNRRATRDLGYAPKYATAAALVAACAEEILRKGTSSGERVF